MDLHPARLVARGTPGAIDVSRYGAEPFRRLSPFARLGPVPIPGRFLPRDHVAVARRHVAAADLTDFEADSVEGIWQALKLLPNVDEQLLRGPARKRRGRPHGHRYGLLTLGYLEARAVVYMPAYRYQLTVLAADAMAALGARATSGELLLADVTLAPDPFDARRPLSHAALIRDALIGALSDYDNADRRLADRAEAIESLYDNDAPDPEARHGWLTAAIATVSATGTRTAPLDTYSAWARRHYQLTLIHEIHAELDADDRDLLTDTLDQWQTEGIISTDEAQRLARIRSPFDG